MDGAVFWLLLAATLAAGVWAFWPRRATRRTPRPGPGAGAEPSGPPGGSIEHPDAPPTSADATVGADAPATGRALAPVPRAEPPPAQPPPAQPPPTEPPPTEPPPTQPPPAQPPRRGQDAAARTAVFAYPTLADTAPDPASTYRHHGDYACLHVITTGFSAAKERVAEVAVVRCDAEGAVHEQWSTVVDPGRDELPGQAWHGLSAGAVHGAPAFPAIASELLTRLEGCVVVAHNAELVEAFLAAEFLRAGMLAPTLPALGLLRWAPLVIPTENARLATLGRYVGKRRSVPSAAIDDALIVAAVLPCVVGRYGDRLAYPVPPTPLTPTPASGGRHRRSAPVLARAAGTTGVPPHGWLAELLAQVPMSVAEGHEARLAAYVDALTCVLPTGRIVAEEVKELTAMAVRAGYPASQLRSVWQRLLETMRLAAFAQGEVTQDQVRHLRAAALSLGVPTYFDDLVQAPPPPAPVPGSGSFSRPVRKPLPPPPPGQAPRCGHCLQPGHYTSTCPQLRRRGGAGGVGRVGGVPGFGPIDPIEPI